MGGAPKTPRSIRELDRSKELRAVWAAALDAVEPGRAVHSRVALEGDELVIGAKRRDLRAVQQIHLIGAGKAACPMADAVCQILGDRLASGLVITKHGHAMPIRGVEVIEAAHPIPDHAALEGAGRLAQRAASAGQGDLLIAVVSGGASSLCTLPAEGIDLDDLQQTNDLLLKSGATIGELNAVRKHLSSIKGGHLVRLTAPAKLAALLLSDVIGDPIDVIGSGLTAPDTTTFSDAWAVMERYHLADRVPKAVRQRLMDGVEGRIAETPKPDDPVFERVHNEIVGSNSSAARAAVRAAAGLGWNSILLSTTVQGEAREVARDMVSLAKQVTEGKGPVPVPACLVWGGETTVHVTGQGVGGRNQELALSAAIALEGVENILLIALATDGTDGPTDAAGAVATGKTVARAQARGLDAAAYMANNDAYRFFEALDDLVLTGPTLTNVGDLILAFCF